MPARLALFGQPVAHSISPWLHDQFARRSGIEIEFELLETGPGELAAELERFAVDGGIGANVTLPLKGEALSCCTELSPRAGQARAVNTLKRTAAEWTGDNTDGAGFFADLSGNLRSELKGKRVLIAGAGGAARGILGPLLSAHPGALFIANRDPEPARAMAKATADPRVAGCGFAVLADMESFDLVINATSAGHQGERPQLPDTLFARSALAYDLSYGAPAEPFVDWAKSAGAGRVCDGRGMLIEQGALSFRCWFGVLPKTGGLLAKLPI